MDQIYVGKVVSTHGIKGEIRILSDFPYKDRVFVVGNTLIIDGNRYVIRSYRIHKNYDMVTLNQYRNINDVLFLMKKSVYVERKSLVLADDEILDEDLITYQVLTSYGKRGIIKEIFFAGPHNKVLRVLFDREVLIPFHSPMIKEIRKDEKEILVDLYEGL